MKHVAIVIGHGPKRDKGAENFDGTTELDWNTDLANCIKSAIGDRLRVDIVRRVTERVQPVIQTNNTGADMTVELHLNSFNGKASGTEMIYYPASSKGKTLATLLQDAAVKTLKLPDRGIKGPQGGGRGMAFLRKTRMPAVIVESFFIDNNKDLLTGNKNKATLANAYADAFVAFSQL